MLSVTARSELSLPPNVRVYRHELSEKTDWSQCLKGQDVIIHTAAMVHQIELSGDRNADVYRAVNVEGTLNQRYAVLLFSGRDLFLLVL